MSAQKIRGFHLQLLCASLPGKKDSGAHWAAAWESTEVAWLRTLGICTRMSVCLPLYVTDVTDVTVCQCMSVCMYVSKYVYSVV